jgi:hydroxyacylglutathione hydrolase
MERVNLGGGLPPRMHPEDVPMLSPAALADRAGDAMVIDTRKPEAFAGGHIARSIAIWLDGLASFGGWVATEDTPILLVLDRGDDVRTAFEHLSRIGIDQVVGAMADGLEAWRGAGRPLETVGVMTPGDLALTSREKGIQVLDVREPDEFDAGHIEGAHHLYVGWLDTRLHEVELDRDAPVAVTCSIGNRSGLGVSTLLRHGFVDVRNVLGGMTGWRALGLPTVGRHARG